MLTWTIIGAIVGVVMGLTGAGAAIISIPLFMHFAGLGLLTATTVSLFSSFFGASFNWALQRGNTWGLGALVIWLTSIPVARFMVDIKANTPEWVIRALIIGFGIYSLAGTWKNPIQRHPSSPVPKTLWAKLILGGVILGVMTVMTGLGGGLFLVPWLTGPLGLSPLRAVATSLITITLASATSWMAQWNAPYLEHVEISSIAALAMGCLGSALGVRLLIRKANAHWIERARRWVFSIVVLIALLSLLKD